MKPGLYETKMYVLGFFAINIGTHKSQITFAGSCLTVLEKKITMCIKVCKSNPLLSESLSNPSFATDSRSFCENGKVTPQGRRKV